MLKTNTFSVASLPLVAKWFLVTLCAWSFNALTLGGVAVRSWAEWQALLLAYGINGAVIGGVMGLGQAWVFNQTVSPKTILVMAALYALALPAGLGLASAIGVWTWPRNLPMLTGSANTFLQLGLSNAAPLAGLIIGLGQWWLWRGQPLPATWRGALWWVLANIFGMALGSILASVAEGLTFMGQLPSALGLLIARALAGSAVGLISSYCLFKLNTQTLTPPASRPTR